jgi:hypothetical protein
VVARGRLACDVFEAATVTLAGCGPTGRILRAVKFLVST